MCVRGRGRGGEGQGEVCVCVGGIMKIQSNELDRTCICSVILHRKQSSDLARLLLIFSCIQFFVYFDEPQFERRCRH